MSRTILADALFVLLAGMFCLAALNGTLAMNPRAVNIDSDLQWYAQILEARLHPEAFAADPVVPLFPHEPGVPNLLTDLAGWLSPTDHAPTNLLYVGSLGIFLHFLMYYALGRWLFGRPSLAAVFSLLMSITVYWAYGTFWGNLHSDPVPRIFFADLWPLLLIGACLAVRRVALRPLVLLLTGCAVNVHTVSTLMFGPMLLMAFALLPQGRPWRRHAAHWLLCAGCFALPVAAYLWWLRGGVLAQPHDEALFAQVRAFRFEEDFQNLWLSLREILAHYSLTQPVLPVGALCWWIAWKNRARLSGRLQSLLALMPGMALGMAGMCVLCALEIWLTSILGRNNYSQEILRGTRFLIPLSWLAATAALALVWPKLPALLRGGAAFGLAFCLFFVSQDKQVLAARHCLAEVSGFAALDTAEGRGMVRAGALQMEALSALRRHIRPGELVFSNNDLMAVRYAAHCPMSPVHKDGNIIYYAKEPEIARRWVEMQRVTAADPRGWITLWKDGEAPLLLTRNVDCREELLGAGDLLFENAEWLLLRRR
ncbi:MAG: hypothetical protein J5960_07155 [Desulfovibrio sp.]|nr:hypothetical protein [Desulfovibrio sp.]